MSRIRELWQRFTEPEESITDPEKRRQARTLAGMLILLMPLAVISAIVIPWLFDPTMPPWRNQLTLQAIPAVALTIVAYMLSRSNYHRAGGILFVAVAAGGILASLFTGASHDQRAAAPFFLAISILISGVVLPIRHTIVTASLLVVSIILISISGFSDLSLAEEVNAIFFLIVVSTFIVIQLFGRQAETEDRHSAEANLRRMERQLQQQQKLEAIGTLAAGVAHEINNPLHAILNYGIMIDAAAEKDSSIKQFASVVVSETSRASEIVSNLLLFSRPTGGEPADHDLREVVNEALRLLRPVLIQDGIELEERIAGAPVVVHCDPQVIQQVIVNMVTNARDALNEKHGGASPEKRLQIEISSVDDEHAVVSITDSGTGIDPEIVDQIFDPFFTTKEPEQGTGLGLAICYGIAQDHEGQLRLVGTSPEGSRFELELPLVT